MWGIILSKSNEQELWKNVVNRIVIKICEQKLLAKVMNTISNTNIDNELLTIVMLPCEQNMPTKVLQKKYCKKVVKSCEQNCEQKL